MRFSIVVPIYKGIKNWQPLLNRCLESIHNQTFSDYEIVAVEEGNWAQNHNAGIRKSKGELIKFLHQDDYFTNKYSLQHIEDNFKTGWLITGSSNNPHPYWTDDIWKGNNKLGAPSCLTIENGNKEPIYFGDLSWMVDCDFYMQLFNRYGKPQILDEVNVNIGIHDEQATNLISNEVKLKEHQILYEKYSGAKTNN